MQTVARKKSNRRTVLLVLLTAAVIAVLTVRAGLGLQKKQQANLAQQQRLEQLIEQEKQRSEDLKAYAEQIGSEEFAIRYAKERMGLIEDDEYVLKGE